MSGSPYPDFPARFRQGSVAIAVGLLSRFGAQSQNELRLSRTTDLIALDTPHTEVPTLADDESISQGGQNYNVVLPGASSAYNYRNRGRNWDLSDDFTRIIGRHAIKFGGGLLARSIQLSVPVYPSGYLQFASVSDFAQGQIQALETQYDKLSGTLAPLSPQRDYDYKQAYGFVQDSFHVSNRVSLDYGLRFEYFGAPVNTGAVSDLTIALASGTSIVQAIQGATQVLQHSNSSVYTTRPSNWAGRLGGSWSPFANGRTVFRASIGMFYDRLFDNLWENIIQNRFATGIFFFNNPVNLSLPLGQIQEMGQLQSSTELIPQLAFQPSLRAPNTNSAFIGVQHSFGPGLSLDVHALASRSRQLITTDEVNRPFSEPISTASPIGRLNPALDYINYRANQGIANYSAMVSALRFRKARFSGQRSPTVVEPLHG